MYTRRHLDISGGISDLRACLIASIQTPVESPLDNTDGASGFQTNMDKTTNSTRFPHLEQQSIDTIQSIMEIVGLSPHADLSLPRQCLLGRFQYNIRKIVILRFTLAGKFVMLRFTLAQIMVMLLFTLAGKMVMQQFTLAGKMVMLQFTLVGNMVMLQFTLSRNIVMI